MSLAVLYRVSNVEHMDYPMEASIRSAMSFADEVCVAADESVDNTNGILEELQKEFGKDRLKFVVYKFQFDRFWQEKAWEEAKQLTECEWLMIMDADEVVHGDHHSKIKAMLKPKVQLVNFPVTHFYGTPDWITTASNFYKSHVRIGRKADGFGMKNYRTDQNRSPVCDVVSCIGGHLRPVHHLRGTQVAQSSVPILHYGWVRSSRAMSYRRIKGLAWYSNDKTFYDGHIPESVRPFSYQMKKHKHVLQKFKGRQPKVLKNWFDLPPHPEEWKALNEEIA